MSTKIHKIGNRGYSSVNGETMFTYELLGAADKQNLIREKAVQEAYAKFPDAFAHRGYTIASYGDNNIFPSEVAEAVKGNPLIPQIINKQVNILYGQGFFLYTEDFDESGTKKRMPVPNQRKAFSDVWKWLDSWKTNGLAQSSVEYIKRVIREYYNLESYFTQWHFNKSRRIGRSNPVRGLELIPSKRCRFAREGSPVTNVEYQDKDFDLVMNGLWDHMWKHNMEVLPRFSESEPFAHQTAINYTRDLGLGEEVYAFSLWYNGLKEWIKASNLNPQYINSYLKNSLNAKLHILIPQSWIEGKEAALNQVVEFNQKMDQAGTSAKKQTQFEGVEVDTVFSFRLIEELIDNKIRLITQLMTGEGENQGKLFTSIKYRSQHGIEEWEFKEIPTKYKEFITSILDFDKQSTKSILAGVGLDPAISNVSNEGVFSNSGAAVYYNYLVYMNQLHSTEEFCMHDINFALWLNFPRLQREGIKLGLYRNVPMRLEETTPEQRPANLTKNQ